MTDSVDSKSSSRTPSHLIQYAQQNPTSFFRAYLQAPLSFRPEITTDYLKNRRRCLAIVLHNLRQILPSIEQTVQSILHGEIDNAVPPDIPDDCIIHEDELNMMDMHDVSVNICVYLTILQRTYSNYTTLLNTVKDAIEEWEKQFSLITDELKRRE
jgi:hypothetical protein